MKKLPPPKLIAVDVDATLILRSGRINQAVVDWLHKRKAEGFRLMLWSMRGKQWALDAATRWQCADLFDCIEGKPGYILDDKGWSWARDTIVITDIGS